MVRRYAAALLFLLVLASGARAQGDEAPSIDRSDGPRRVMTAAPAQGIRVDGALDEAAWAAATPATDFVQFEPTEGAPASQQTEVRVLYGPSDLYVGAYLYDTEPDRIRRFLSRRDDDGDADFFIVGLDGYNDRKTAYLFGVTAAGVQFDAFLGSNGDDDESWDAVWDSEVRIVPDGWVIEMRIPYSQLRFSEGAEAWGIQFLRDIPRTGEEAFWTPFGHDEANSGIVQFFGRLDGLSGVRPRRAVQVAPYSLARAHTFEHGEVPGTTDSDVGADVGADLKLGLASNVILDATINPDFGQVEADPAQLNLSTFETFFQEKRPFFLEGTQIFDFQIGNGDGALLYTRRIGAASRIIGATKLSARLPSGLSVGVLTAATGNDFDPSQFFGVTRLRREFGTQNYVGASVTAFDDDGAQGGTARRAFAGAADWDLRLGADRAYMFSGVLAGSQRQFTGPDDPAPTQRGYALYVGFDRVKGYFTPGSGLRIYSPGFDVNDVGRFRQNDLIQGRLGMGYLLNRGEPIRPFRRFNTYLVGTQTWRYADGLNRGLELQAGGGGQLLNFHALYFDLGFSGLGGYDVRETRGLGPVRHLRSGGINVNYVTDERKRFVVYPGFNMWLTEGGGRSTSGWTDVSWNASTRVSFSAGAYLSADENATAWAANESLFRMADGLFIGDVAGAPGAFEEADLHALDLDEATVDALLDGVAPFEGTHGIEGAAAFHVPVFGLRDTRTASLTVRTNLLFSPTLSLQLYGQLFGARGRYDGFRLLANPDEFRDFEAYPKRRDFAFHSLNANVVLRWQYRPGSTLFVVWTQARNDGTSEELLLDGSTPPRSPFDVTTLGHLGDTFRIFPENVFLVKLNYLLMR
ncbi:MAG TPA: DUF5916 domain-containing protein [Rubricoccaceae bacterium]|nr:DUF5916 domain-containing protein [Rubricoccaceae bacterium]